MKATGFISQHTPLEEAIRNKDITTISAWIKRKEYCLKEARENAEFHTRLVNMEFAEEETARVQRLTRDLKALREAI